MPTFLSASVGAGGKNVPADVLTVQVNMNRVRPADGGPAVPLDTDAKVGPLTTGAIARFQKVQFGWSDGRIDVGQKTHRRLDALLAAVGTPNSWPDEATRVAAVARVLALLAGTPAASALAGAAGWLPTLSPARLTAIEVALAETRPAGHGQVTDRVGWTSEVDPVDGKRKTHRFGWRKLKAYFDEAMPGFLAARWHKPEAREGILCKDKRVQEPGLPQAPGTTAGVQWCGIFDTWVYKRAQARWPDFRWRPLRWMMPFISMPRQLALEHGGKLDLRPGDVGVILKNTHHFLILSPPSGGTNSAVWIVSGNDEWQSILVRTMPVSKILMRYDCDEIFL